MADTIYMNRELSWLKFNERVLEEAENPENPLCERLTFASIYQSNLDEFYMVRVGSLVDQMLLAKDIRENKTNMTPEEQLDAILARTKKLNHQRSHTCCHFLFSFKHALICFNSKDMKFFSSSVSSLKRSA